MRADSSLKASPYRTSALSAIRAAAEVSLFAAFTR